MGRIHGKRGAFYAALASGAAASPVAFLSDWSVSFTTEFNEVTAFGDPNKIYVAGKVVAVGDFAGFYDDSTRQLYTAARDGTPRPFFLYPDITNGLHECWTGVAVILFSASGSVHGAVSVKGSWAAASGVSFGFQGNILDQASVAVNDQLTAPLADQGLTLQ